MLLNNSCSMISVVSWEQMSKGFVKGFVKISQRMNWCGLGETFHSVTRYDMMSQNGKSLPTHTGMIWCSQHLSISTTDRCQPTTKWVLSTEPSPGNMQKNVFQLQQSQFFSFADKITFPPEPAIPNHCFEVSHPLGGRRDLFLTVLPAFRAPLQGSIEAQRLRKQHLLDPKA